MRAYLGLLPDPPVGVEEGPDLPQQIGSWEEGVQAHPSCCLKGLWWLRCLHVSWKARVTGLQCMAGPLGISPGDQSNTVEVRVLHQVLLLAH